MKKTLCFLICMLFVSVSLQAQNNADELLKAVQEKFKSVNDLSADVQYNTQKKGGSKGKVFFKKDDKIRLELQNMTLVSDGSTTWNHSKKDNKVIINSHDETSHSALSFDELLHKYPDQSDVTVSGNVLTLTPKKNSELNFSSVKLWVNKENLINKIEVQQAGGGKIEIELSNYKVNQNLPDSQFTLSPPEGSQVIDLR
jgi:outer membrane lipoprotein-sorting protein